MIFKVSTTGTVSSVPLPDLGLRTLTHPTVDLDLGLEYSEDELRNSIDLANALLNGELIVTEEQDTSATKEYVDTTISGAILEKGSLATVQVENEGNTTVNTTWTDFTFSNTIYENRTDVVEHNPSDLSEILIKADGTYSVTYGLVVEAQTTATSSYSRVLKDGVLIAGSDSEIRTYQQERHELGGNATFDATAGAIIKIQHQRSADGAVNIVHAAANVIKLDGVKGDPGDQGPPGTDGQDGVLTISGSADYFNGYDAAGTTQLGTTYTDIPLTEGYTTSAFSHSGAEVTINAENTYLIVGRFTVAQPTTADRSEAQMRMVVDTGGGYTEIPGTVGVCYSRNTTQGKSTASAHAVLDLNAGDKIKLQAQENSGGDLFGEQNGSGLMLFTTAGQTGPQGLQGPPGEDGTDGTDGVDGVDGIDAGGTLSVVQARRSTAYTLTTTYTDVTFDITDEETDPAVVEHNNSSTARIDIKDAGTFLVIYDFNIDASSSNPGSTFAEGQVYLNNTSTIAGSWSRTTTLNESSIDANALFHNHLSGSCVETLTAGDYITLQLRYTGTAAATAINGTIKVINLVGARGADGADGAPGVPGSGSTILVRDENGNYLSNAPNDTIRFFGTGVNVVAEGDATARVTINRGINIMDESVAIANTPHHTINFTGSPVSAYDLGSGVAGVWVQPPTFGTWYAWGGDETETNTNSTTPVPKATLTVTGVPAGYYRASWYYEWRRNTTSNDYMANVVVDSTTTIMEHRQENQDVNSWNNVCGYDILNLTAGDHTIVFSHYGDSAASTSYTRRARLEIWRVA